MSTEHARKVVEQFVASGHSDLLVLKGGWGVGKTHFWQDIVSTAKAENKFGKGRYSYVSLFGINNLEELRNIIMATREDIGAKNEEGGFKNFTNTLKQIVAQAENVPALREYTGGIASQAVFMLLRNTLICLDDLERRGDGLAIKDVMGLASLLTEQRDCQVVIIMNEGSLPQSEAEEFRKHSEKIVDVELQFSPSAEEVFSYVFSVEYPYYTVIRRFVHNLDIHNIRIIQRIRRFINDLLPYFQTIEAEVIEEALRSIILFVWCYYDRDSGAPPLKYVREFDFVQYILPGNEQKVKPEEQEWYQLLTKYGYRGTNDLDRHLISFVETGYLNGPAFSEDIEKRNEAAKAQQGQDAYSQVWKLYHNSFDNNEDEFIEQLLSTFRLSSSFLSLPNLQNTVWALRELGHGEKASELIHDYLLLHKEALSQASRDHLMFIDNIDEEIMKELNSLWSEAKQLKDPLEVIKSIASRNGWSPDDIEVLSRTDTDDYYNIFKAENSDSLYQYVRACLQFRGITGTSSDAQYKMIAEKVETALRRIAQESRINQLRVSKIYKIPLDPEQ